MEPRGDCWVWDGWQGVCKQWHRAEWWTYTNVWSVAAVVAVCVVAVVVVAFVFSRLSR